MSKKWFWLGLSHSNSAIVMSAPNNAFSTGTMMRLEGFKLCGMLDVVSNDPTKMTLFEPRETSSATVPIPRITPMRAAQITAAAVIISDVDTYILQPVQRGLSEWLLLVIDERQQELEDLAFAWVTCLVHFK